MLLHSQGCLSDCFDCRPPIHSVGSFTHSAVCQLQNNPQTDQRNGSLGVTQVTHLCLTHFIWSLISLTQTLASPRSMLKRIFSSFTVMLQLASTPNMSTSKSLKARQHAYINKYTYKQEKKEKGNYNQLQLHFRNVRIHPHIFICINSLDRK